MMDTKWMDKPLWAVVGVLLAAYLMEGGAWLTGLLAVLVGIVGLAAWRDKSPITFPVQIRVFYLAGIVVGLLPGMAFLHGIQLVGLMAYLLADYCLMARLVVLLPWNRAVPLSWAVVQAALLSSPKGPCIVHVVNAVGADELAEKMNANPAEVS